MQTATCHLSVCIIAALGAAIVGILPAFGAGQAVGIKHPVLKHNYDPDAAAQYEKAVERVMAMREEEMLAFVPEKPFMYFCHCPHCHGGVEGFYMYKWSIEDPEHIKCKFCGTIYPNDKYPLDQTLSGENALGETITYKYYHEQDTGMNYMFADHVFLYKRTWIVKQCAALGLAYQATGKPEYARRAALIIDRCAQVYPHYPVVMQGISSFSFAKSQQPPYPGAGGKWGRWIHEEFSQGPIDGYDLIYDSDELDKLSEQRGYDVRENYEKNFIKARFEYINTCTHHTSNMAPHYLQSAIRIGWTINEPSYVHWAYRWLLEILYGHCYYDGMWNEAPSYHYQTLSGLERCFKEMRGYSDPAGYVDAVDGTRFDNLNPDTDIAFFAKAKDAPAVIGFPDGHICPVHDTWATSRPSQPRNKTVSTICPGYGHASLGRGDATNQMQAQLHFSAANGHAHLDNLNLTLFAKEREMLSDVGYTWTQGRYWTICTVGHNLVAVDRSDQQSNNSDGDLLCYFPDTDGISVVEADGKRGYTNIEGLDLYRRIFVLIPVSDADAYLVDIFHTHGGSVHDWLLHGDANEDMTATCNIPLSPRPGDGTMLEEGEKWEEPKTEQNRFIPYGAIRQVRQGKTAASFTTDFRYAEQSERGVRIHLLGDAGTEVYLGQSPSIRRAGTGASGDYRKTFDFWMPQLVARRRGEAPLQTTFVAIEEPFLGEPFIKAARPLELSPSTDGAVALEVTHGNITDTIISTLDAAPYPVRTTAGGVSLKGRLGIVRHRGGEFIGAWVFEGEAFSGPDFDMKMGTARYTGQIQAATRKADGDQHDAFMTDADLPEGAVLHGSWIIVTHANGLTHGYEIDRIEQAGDKSTIILTMDHGLKIDGASTQEVYFPRRKMEGVNTFSVPVAASATRGR